jgi:hypothetical protein
MALTPRKKKGIGFFISGAAFIVGGALAFAASEDPSWWPTAISLVGMVASFFGFTTVFPDQE